MTNIEERSLVLAHEPFGLVEDQQKCLDVDSHTPIFFE